jgi:peroxiredoxin
MSYPAASDRGWKSLSACGKLALMSRRIRGRSWVIAFTIGTLSLAGSGAANGVEKTLVPARLVSVQGETVDVESLASNARLFFVTLKATWCRVCQVQLRRLFAILPRLRSCEATFVVLAPGPRLDLIRIAEETSFPYPFVEDVGLAIARAVGLRLAAGEIEPAIFEVSSDREIVWMQRGRNGSYFGDGALLERLDCDDLYTAMR